MSDSILNLDSVQFDALRKEIDAPFRALADKLDVAYYQHWKLGQAHDFYGYDPITSGTPAKETFDRLTGLIWTEYESTLIAENERRGQLYDQDKINPIQEDARRRFAHIQDQLTQSAADGFAINGSMKAFLDAFRVA